MRHKHTELAEAPFLDVVTNLIGILIIIIMVTGTRTTETMADAAVDAKSADNEDALGELAGALSVADAIEKDIHDVTAKLQRQQLEIAYRRSERDKTLAFLTAIEQEVTQQEQQLSAAQQEQLEKNRELRAARSELGEVKTSRESLERAPPTPNVIEQLPTPLAKAVFGQEVHFQLLGGRLTYVPWDEMVEALKREAPDKVYKLKDSAEVTEALGPIRGFRMEYTLRRGQQMAPVGRGTVAVSQTIELDRFILVPVNENLGEPLEQAFRENSELLAMLSRYEAKRTTVTVWVYPDSFGKFRDLKAKLYELGFLASARPMPEGHPIGGSPRGSRSAAE
jgi:hypothetical protein